MELGTNETNSPITNSCLILETPDCEQPEKTVVDPRQERTGSTVGTVWREWPIERCAQELSDLGARIQVRPGPLGLERQEPRCRYLRARIACTSIARELADMTEAARPVSRLSVRRPLRPVERQSLGSIRGATTFHECGELRQRLAALPASRSLNPKLRRIARYSSVACGRVFIGHLPARAEPAYVNAFRSIDQSWCRNGCCIRVMMSQHGADLGERSALAQHIARQSVGKLMRSIGGSGNARALQAMSNNRPNAARALKASHGSLDAHKDPTRRREVHCGRP